MTLDHAKKVVKAVQSASKHFKAIGDPVLTKRGARVEFAVITVDPKNVSIWFEKQGATVLMVGAQDLYDNGGTMYAEFMEKSA